MVLDIEDVPGVLDTVTDEEVTLHNVTGNRTKTERKLRVEALDPERVLWPEDQTLDRSTWWFVSYKSRMRLSELREMGFDVRDDIPDAELDTTDLESYRNLESYAGMDGDVTDLAGIDPSLRKVWVYESYIKTDTDGDGIAEWNRVLQVADEILESSPVTESHMYCITPVIRTHDMAGK